MGLAREQIIDGNIKEALGTKQEAMALEAIYAALSAQIQVTHEEFWGRVKALRNAALAQCPECGGTGTFRTGAGFFINKKRCAACEGTGSADEGIIAHARAMFLAEERRQQEIADQAEMERLHQIRVLQVKKTLRRKKLPLWMRMPMIPASASPAEDLINSLLRMKL